MLGARPLVLWRSSKRSWRLSHLSAGIFQTLPWSTLPSLLEHEETPFSINKVVLINQGVNSHAPLPPIMSLHIHWHFNAGCPKAPHAGPGWSLGQQVSIWLTSGVLHTYLTSKACPSKPKQSIPLQREPLALGPMQRWGPRSPFEPQWGWEV